MSIFSSYILVQNFNQIPYAYGHALPVTYSPAPNSIISTTKSPPSKIIMAFSERPDPKVSFIHVTDSNDKRVDNNDFKITGEQNGRVVQVTLDTHKLTDGVFTVSWLTMSIDDGHIARGSYVFGIGDVNNLAGTNNPMALPNTNNQMQQNQVKTEAVTSNVDGVIKWPLIVAQTAVVGGIISHLFLLVNNKLVRNKIYLSLKSFSNIDNNKYKKDSKNNEKALYKPIKTFVLLMCTSSITILVFSSALLFLQINDLSSTSANYLNVFITLLHGPVGTVWILRTLTAATIFFVSITYYFLEKKRLTKEFLFVDNNQVTKSSFNNKYNITTFLLYFALISGSISIFSNSMTSHSSGVNFFPDIAISLDWLHFMAVSIWVGGLFYISTVIVTTVNFQKLKEYVQQKDKQNDSSNNIHQEAKDNDNFRMNGEYFLTLLLPRFSLLATASLGIIGVSGLYIAWIHLHTFENIFDTVYGNILIVKLLSALPMVVIGGYHQLKIHHYMVKLSSLAKGVSSYSNLNNENNTKKKYNIYSRFSKTIKIESIIGIVVLFFASILTITSPPGSMNMDSMNASSMMGNANSNMNTNMLYSNHNLGNLNGQNGRSITPSKIVNNSYSNETNIQDVNTKLQINPFYTGFNTFKITFTGTDGKPAKNISNVILQFTNKKAEIGPIVVSLNKISEGVYSIFGGYISQKGEWTIQLTGQRIGAYDLNYNYDVHVNPHPKSNISITSKSTTDKANSTTNEQKITINSKNNGNMMMEQSEPSPTFDSFAILAVALAAIVIVGSSHYFRKSKQELQQTIEMYERSGNGEKYSKGD
ncbi:MAG TPA: CopD family protein [Verrucomicrobiae bacterium]|nr:CopD family protein [Verrucomicrobiae bacterium]